MSAECTFPACDCDLSKPCPNDLPSVPTCADGTWIDFVLEMQARARREIERLDKKLNDEH